MSIRTSTLNYKDQVLVTCLSVQPLNFRKLQVTFKTNWDMHVQSLSYLYNANAFTVFYIYSQLSGHNITLLLKLIFCFDPFSLLNCVCCQTTIKHTEQQLQSNHLGCVCETFIQIWFFFHAVMNKRCHQMGTRAIQPTLTCNLLSPWSCIQSCLC